MNLNRMLCCVGLAAVLGACATPMPGPVASKTAPVQADRKVRVINETRHTMMQFYASNVNRTSWEEDILGQSTLPVGGSVMVNIDDGSGACMFDFKGVFDDGDEVIKNGINVCEISSFRFTED